MVSRIGIVFVGLGVVVLSQAAFADQSLRCDRKQKFCITDDKSLTLGDKVGVFNKYDELVAAGEVDGMKGQRRRFSIYKRTAMITEDDRIQRIEDRDAADLENHFKMAKEAPKVMVGASAGLTSLDIASGNGSAAYDFEGFAEYRWKWGLRLVGRGIYLWATGNGADLGSGNQSYGYTVNCLGFIPGLAYMFLPKDIISFRVEAGAGGGVVNRQVSNGMGDTRAIDKMQDGTGLIARGEFSVLYNGLGNWHPEASASALIIQESVGATLALGLIKDLK